MSEYQKTRKIVEVLKDPGAEHHTWKPEVGPEAQEVISSRVPEPSRETVRREAVSILRNCVAPDAPEEERTGLVLGRIQSGKTLSYITVSALAKDNGYRLIVVITGTRTDLFQQANERLEEALNTDEIGGWEHYRSDNLHPGLVRKIQSTLNAWDDGPVEGLKDTVLVTVMKERHHLRDVNELLDKLDLGGMPTLVIDDEADRAGLNIQPTEEERSATNRRLMRLRGAIPHHTYLQYTATPQAILLLNLIDTLSPYFAQVLTPGSSYTGGEAFFKGDTALIRPIPSSELPDDEAPGEFPMSLEEALQTFFVGATAEFVSGKTKVNRSMMVHPDRLTKIHYQYYRWIESAIARWRDGLSDKNDPAFEECVEGFWGAYEDLSMTVEDIPPFDDDFVDVLLYVLNNAVTLEINSANRDGTSSASPNWSRDRWHILVGGDKLDRGLTIEGLTVSYMSRQRGVGNADTIQQRARWFGYKEDYLGYCRVYLPRQTISDYRSLVEHETSIRNQIEYLAEREVPVRQWRRKFLLDRELRPTRRSVVQNEVRAGRFEDEWVYVRSPHCPGYEGILARNRGRTRRFLSQLAFSEDEGDERRRESHRHLVRKGVSLKRVYEELLTEYEVRGQSDLARYTGALMQIGSYRDEHEGGTCAVYHMRANASGTFERGLDEVGRIKDLFQGAYPTEDVDKIYPGDRAIRSSEDDLTVQIHWLDRLRDTNDSVVARNVPVLAMYITSRFAADWVVGHDISRDL